MDGPTSVEDIDLRGYWQILVRRRWVVYLAVIGLGLLALVLSFLTTPQYRSTTTLQIARRSPEIFNFKDVTTTDYGWAAYSDFFQTQYEIIASGPVARIAAERLELPSHPDFLVTEEQPGWLARVKAMIPRKRGVRVEQDPLDRAASRVRAALEVLPVRNSQLVRISCTDADPNFAATLANAVADAYIHFSIESLYSTTDQAREFLIDQSGKLKREIGAIENRLQEYGESRRIISVSDSTNLTLQALQEISAQRTAAQTAVARAEAARRTVLATGSDALPEVLNSNLIARLRADYAAYEAEYSEESRLFKDSWPKLQTLASRLEQARQRLDLEVQRINEQVRAAADADYERAVRQVDNLDLLLAQHEQAAQRMKRDAVEFNNLQSEVREKRETLNALLARQNEMTLSTRLRDLDATSSNIRVMERAQPPTAPFRPNTRLNLAVALALGLTLGVAAASLLEHLDNTINSPAELARAVALPVLAVIPRYGGSPTPFARARRRPSAERGSGIDLVADREAHSAVSEAYRGLRTSILLSNPGHPPRLIVLTSALPEDGKTSTVLNLGIVLAQLGRRVLLVDTDLRRPRLHRALAVTNRRGVSTFLSGLVDDPYELVVPTGIDNLDVMTSGPIPPNPSELLNSPTFARLGTELLEHGYDHILFDSPPVLSVSDPVIVASSVDSGILVVRAGRTPRQSVRLAIAGLGRTGRCTFGLVLNEFDAGAQAQYQSYYGQRRPDEEATDSGTESAADSLTRAGGRRA